MTGKPGVYDLQVTEGVRITKELRDVLDAEAKRIGVKRSALVRYALRWFMNLETHDDVKEKMIEATAPDSKGSFATRSWSQRVE